MGIIWKAYLIYDLLINYASKKSTTLILVTILVFRPYILSILEQAILTQFQYYRAKFLNFLDGLK